MKLTKNQCLVIAYEVVGIGKNLVSDDKIEELCSLVWEACIREEARARLERDGVFVIAQEGVKNETV